MRAALYARVSTADKDQDPETQLHGLRTWASQHGHEVAGEYVDRASAVDMRARTQWRRLLDAGGYDVVAIVRLDRAWRSTVMMLADLEHLERRGKGFVSITQPVDTTGALGRMVLQILSAVAEFERELIRERTREGLARAAANGRRPGRPKGSLDRVPRKRGVR